MSDHSFKWVSPQKFIALKGGAGSRSKMRGCDAAELFPALGLVVGITLQKTGCSGAWAVGNG